MKITIVEVNDICGYPPIMGLIDNLLCNGHEVFFIGAGLEKLPDYITNAKLFNGYEIGLGYDIRSDIRLKKVFQRIKLRISVRIKVKELMQNSDVLWTTSYNTIKLLGKLVLRYKNVMQILELVDKGYVWKKIEFPLAEYARHACEIVVPEENRAYILKAIWGLKKIPIVLPNKPYRIEKTNVTEDIENSLNRMKNEKRKIILYLGGIWRDRDLKPFAKAIQHFNKEYCIYIIGKPYGKEAEEQLNILINEYGVVYLGWFVAPKHMLFLEYAYIGLLSYASVSGETMASINSLYCAPNKIFEYAAFGIPMLGNNVLGLKNPFEKYQIGICCDDNDVENIKNALVKIENNYDEMKKNSLEYFKSVNLDKIVNNILNDIN